ncbi:LLM class flavin-dependent oxidoreductase [Gordonia sp. CPCC 206044]|uniref:LLM class flavin-dependent oxidoreductase n=1 Tax=Gordonia sp. CPCC 206044 TaxID=3140793 RepID=UPI003AF3A24B
MAQQRRTQHPRPHRRAGFHGRGDHRDPLVTNLYVLPFHTPYLAAKALGSLDILAGGRVIAGVGAGYLRSEFTALGAYFDRRATLFDEGLAALRSIWRSPEKPVRGDDFEAIGPVALQPPRQQPHPPIWIGGNSRAALRRVVDHGDGVDAADRGPGQDLVDPDDGDRDPRPVLRRTRDPAHPNGTVRSRL